MTLPLLLAVGHAGLRVPPEVEGRCILTPAEIADDGDGGAADIYLPLESSVTDMVSTDVARAVVDVNRDESDRRRDGVVKTHTCWNVPVYGEPLPEDTVEVLLAKYYRPYHDRLSSLAGPGVILGVDCHTMAAEGPPIGPDPGRPRPTVCLSNANRTCPRRWIERLADCFHDHFPGTVQINRPFQGGYTILSHSAELPWVQLELTRGPVLSEEEKGARVFHALRDWVSRHGSSDGMEG